MLIKQLNQKLFHYHSGYFEAVFCFKIGHLNLHRFSVLYSVSAKRLQEEEKYIPRFQLGIANVTKTQTERLIQQYPIIYRF